jgi:hypothetical protein
MQIEINGKQYMVDMNMCLETYPCQHYVRNIDDNTFCIMSAVDIYNILKKQGIKHDHFEQYTEWIRRCNNPTQEEIDELIKWEKR